MFAQANRFQNAKIKLLSFNDVNFFTLSALEFLVLLLVLTRTTNDIIINNKSDLL